jgi:LmbE family N-acetylglucosaminyl deacetylase
VAPSPAVLARALARRLLVLGARPVTLGRLPHLLVVAPHPDDETLGCAALIERAIGSRRTVDVVLVGDGSGSHPGGADVDELRQRRSLEFTTALDVLGVSPHRIHRLDVPDGGIAGVVDEVTAALASLLTNTRPGLVVVTSRWESHPDHAATAEATHRAVASLAAEARPAVWEYPIWLWTDWPVSRRVFPVRGVAQLVRLLVTRRVWSVPVGAGALKREALDSYGSQLGAQPGDPTLPDSILAMAVGGPELFLVTEPTSGRLLRRVGQRAPARWGATGGLSPGPPR